MTSPVHAGGRARCVASVAPRMGTAVPAEHDAETSRPGAPSEPPARSGTWLTVGVAMVAAAALSLPRLGSRTMWLDEVYTVGATSELLDTWRRTGGTQALYYLLVWPVAQVSTDPWAMRLPSVLFALAALGVVYEIGRRIWDVRVGVLATGGLALSWGLARYSMEARSYTLALLLVSLSGLALVALVQGGDPDAAGRGLYQSGEIHRLRGDLAEAEADYRAASQKGREPQPGLALLRFAQGDGAAAAGAVCGG